jgi:hypothetical protein
MSLDSDWFMLIRYKNDNYTHQLTEDLTPNTVLGISHSWLWLGFRGTLSTECNAIYTNLERITKYHCNNKNGL